VVGILILKLIDVNLTFKMSSFNSITSEREPINCPWLSLPFIPVEYLFYDICGAREYITKYLETYDGNGIDVIRDSVSSTKVNLSFKFDANSLPRNLYSEVESLRFNLMYDYIPDLEKKFRGLKITDNLLCAIKSEIKSYEQQIISQGGLSLIDEFAFRLGIEGIFGINLKIGA
jgi:hypothetical protein